MKAAMPPTQFEIGPAEKYILVQLHGDLEAESSAQFADKVSLKNERHSKDFVFDCTDVSAMSGAWVRVLVHLQQQLTSVSKQLRLFGLKPAVSLYLRQEGVAGFLRSCTNLNEALKEVGLMKASGVMDVELVNPFLLATVVVLETQAGTKATAGKIYTRAGKDQFLGDISGVIGIVSENFSGSFVISFPAATFLKILSRMIGEECAALNSETADGAGELTNIIFGHAKVVLNQRGLSIQTALPTVVSGAEHSVSPVTEGPRVVVPFTTDVGDFFIEIGMSA